MTAPRFEPGRPARGPIVQGFSGGKFAVHGALFGAVLLSPEAAFGWDPPALDLLTLADLGPILAMTPHPEFLILGTGPAMAFAPKPLARDLAAEGISIEAMDSRAAARTWSMLRGEERWIAAALLPL